MASNGGGTVDAPQVRATLSGDAQSLTQAVSNLNEAVAGTAQTVTHALGDLNHILAASPDVPSASQTGAITPPSQPPGCCVPNRAKLTKKGKRQGQNLHKFCPRLIHHACGTSDESGGDKQGRRLLCKWDPGTTCPEAPVQKQTAKSGVRASHRQK